MPFLRPTAVRAVVIVSLRRIAAVLALVMSLLWITAVLALGGAGVMPFLGVAAVLALGVEHASFLVLPAYRLKSSTCHLVSTYYWVYFEARTGTREERQRKEEVGLRQEEGGEEEERSEE